MENAMMVPSSRNPCVSGEEELFDALVRHGEEDAVATLPPLLHSFLVRCLVEYLRDHSIVDEAIALNYLRAVEVGGAVGNHLLKRAGDEALILAGLFPERALRLNVTRDYFRAMGQSAYGTYAANLVVVGLRDSGAFYNTVARQFSLLTRVLRATRRPGSDWAAYRRFLSQLH